MTSTHKLTFKSGFDCEKFAFVLLNKFATYKAWLEECDFLVRKNVMYVDARHYTCIENFLSNNRNRYGYELVKR